MLPLASELLIAASAVLGVVSVVILPDVLLYCCTAFMRAYSQVTPLLAPQQQ
jgi:hypothetical protein